MRFHRWTALLAAAAAIPLGAKAQEVPFPDDVFYYAPAATAFGPEAVWVNPAVLGPYKPATVAFMGDLAEGSVLKNWGTVITRRGFGLAYRRIDSDAGEDFKEYALAGGLSLGSSLSVGGSYRYFPSGPSPYDHRHYWNIGLTSRGNSPFAVGAVWSNLNRSELEGEDTRVIQRYSLGYRPQGATVTLAVDALSSAAAAEDDWTYIYHAQVIPATGLSIEAFVDSDGNFEIGARANLLEYFVGTQSHFDSDAGHRFSHLVVGATDSRQPSLIRGSARRLSVSVSGAADENPVQTFFGARRPAFADLVLGIYRAAGDPGVGEMVLHLDNLRLTLAQAQEMREAMAWFRAQGKSIVSHLTGPNNIAYYVACAGDSILIPPVSDLDLIGLRAELTFFAGTMEKLGVAADMVRIGDYKTAPEAYTMRTPSEANREMTNRLLDDLYAQFVGGLAEGRGMDPEAMRGLIDSGPYTSTEALDLGLVDGLTYRDRLVPDKFLSPLPEISFRAYRADTLMNDGWPPLPEIAVVYADGEIQPEGAADPSPLSGRGREVTPALMESAFGQALANPQVQGVVFRIDSPGGYALAGNEIFHRAELAARQKPVVVSMGSRAASGGYYIAMAGRHIFADPATITGSIGIFGGKPVLAGLYDKIELGKELFTRGRHAGMMTSMRPFTDEERARLGAMLGAFYDHFVGLVAENRRLPRDSIDQLGRGRVWTGQAGREHGLVDELGGLKQALDYTASHLGLREYRVVRYPERRRLIDLPQVPVLGWLGRWAGLVGEEVRAAAAPLADLPEGELLARLPYDIDIR
ncbi:MAG TPA: S49 family peptidase [candidate division Zixibacteria bacterium]|nr:S49 family peptidase [candidate division Zixibacteria bacterium]MDD4918244.1 S49 family peptidase [candidate division Zixibacteria bacterium]MDM7973985.1 S49 family peptidase [candidate division Zixibacteria bacterium]HOD66524.1 S49 family peptidase [candidate division Zixibacteria bacterium]